MIHPSIEHSKHMTHTFLFYKGDCETNAKYYTILQKVFLRICADAIIKNSEIKSLHQVQEKDLFRLICFEKEEKSLVTIKPYYGASDHM